MTGRRPRLGARTVPVQRVDDATCDAMWRLYRTYYADVDRETFVADLATKDHVILLETPRSRQLQGFSTLTRGHLTLDGRRLRYVFSGDTVIAPEYWGGSALQNAFGRYITRTWLARPWCPTYWFLISKGYKTYLLLTRNFPDHWPRHDRPTPDQEARLIDSLATSRFGDRWHPKRGIIEAGSGTGHLRPETAPVPRQLAHDPDVLFFLGRNPGHGRGDELACLGRIGPTIWLAYVRKRLARRMAKRRADPGRHAAGTPTGDGA